MDEESEEEEDSDDEPISKRKKPKEADKPKSRGTKRPAKQRTQPSRDAAKVCSGSLFAPERLACIGRRKSSTERV